MANTAQNFDEVLITYKDIKDNNPQWSDSMIEDYLALKRNLLLVSGASDNIVNTIIGTDGATLSLLADLKQQVGSGSPLTSDETGFTVDSTKLTVDQTEA